MSTVWTVEFKVSFLKSLGYKELCVVPLSIIFNKELCKCLLTGPLDADPLESLLLLTKHIVHKLILNRELAIDVIFNLLNGRVSLLIVTRLLLQCNLKPICYFKNVPFLQILVQVKILKRLIARYRFFSNGGEILPVKYLLII